MTLEEKREHLSESLKMLSGHEPFRMFMRGLQDLKEDAIRTSCRIDVVDDYGKLVSCIGEVRAYLDIQDMVAEFSPKQLD